MVARMDHALSLVDGMVVGFKLERSRYLQKPIKGGGGSWRYPNEYVGLGWANVRQAKCAIRRI